MAYAVMKRGVGVVVFAVIMTVLAILYLSGPGPLPAAQIAVLFVFWLLIGGGIAAAIRWRKGRQPAEPGDPTGKH